jgi:hypothetical protein
MAYEIEPRKVAGVVIEANQALVNKGFNQGEVLLGLSELLGRMIVEAADNQIQADEMVKVVHQHMELTIKIGSQATEKSIIERV